MKKKIFSFMLAICLILPTIFMLSACSVNSKEDKLRYDFYDVMIYMDNDLHMLEFNLSSDLDLNKPIVYSGKGEGKLYLSRSNGKTIIKNSENATIGEYGNGDSLPSFVLTGGEVASMMQELSSCRYVVYSGYCIDIENNTWSKDVRFETDVNNFYDNVIFYKNGYDYSVNQRFATYRHEYKELIIHIADRLTLYF